jgi:hypothetical protein
MLQRSTVPQHKTVTTFQTLNARHSTLRIKGKGTKKSPVIKCGELIAPAL